MINQLAAAWLKALHDQAYPRRIKLIHHRTKRKQLSPPKRVTENEARKQANDCDGTGFGLGIGPGELEWRGSTTYTITFVGHSTDMRHVKRWPVSSYYENPALLEIVSSLGELSQSPALPVPADSGDIRIDVYIGLLEITFNGFGFIGPAYVLKGNALRPALRQYAWHWRISYLPGDDQPFVASWWTAEIGDRSRLWKAVNPNAHPPARFVLYRRKRKKFHSACMAFKHALGTVHRSAFAVRMMAG